MASGAQSPPTCQAVDSDAASLGDLSVFCTFEAAQVHAAAKGVKLPYAEWVKTAICHFCGGRGHIKPECQKWKGLSRAERDKWNANNKSSSGGTRSAPSRTDTRRAPPRRGDGRGRSVHNIINEHVNERVLKIIEEHAPDLLEMDDAEGSKLEERALTACFDAGEVDDAWTSGLKA